MWLEWVTFFAKKASESLIVYVLIQSLLMIFFVLFDYSCRDFFYGTTSVIVITSVCFHNLFFFHLFFPRYNCWLAFKLRAWSTSIIFYDFYWCRWICFVEICLWYKQYYSWSFNVCMRSSFIYSLISSPSFSHLKSVLTHFNNFFCK